MGSSSSTVSSSIIIMTINASGIIVIMIILFFSYLHAKISATVIIYIYQTKEKLQAVEQYNNWPGIS